MSTDPQALFSAYFSDSPRGPVVIQIQDEEKYSPEQRIFIRFFESGAVARVSVPVPQKSAKEPSEIELEEAPAFEEVSDDAFRLDEEDTAVAEPVAEPVSKETFFSRVRRGLSKTRSSFSAGLADMLLGKKAINDDLLEEIETQLLIADIGVAATRKIIDNLTQKVSRSELKDSDALYEALQKELSGILMQSQHTNWQVDPKKTPYVILMVGVNGVGKTTTIGKLAKKLQNDGLSVMLAAGDTFRAAAVEQLQVWGQRNDVPVVAQHTGADSASVIFDAVQSAKAKGVDVLLADTAGRLHNKSNLMEELKKITRVMQKVDPGAPHEVMLVVDAGTGQNALNQAKEFNQAIGLTGITLTKLDGTAKGGIVFAIADTMQLPIRFIGVGEQIDDLRPFEAEPFVKALFSAEES